MALRAVARNLSKVARPTLARRGKAFAALVGEWPAIIGAELAVVTLPERLNTASGREAEGGVLTIRVTGGAAMELQQLTPQVIERINAYLGYKAVVRLRLLQAPMPGQTPPRAPIATPAPADRAAVAAEVAGIDDPGLRAALTAFGLAVKSRDRQRT